MHLGLSCTWGCHALRSVMQSGLSCTSQPLWVRFWGLNVRKPSPHIRDLPRSWKLLFLISKIIHTHTFGLSHQIYGPITVNLAILQLKPVLATFTVVAPLNWCDNPKVHIWKILNTKNNNFHDFGLSCSWDCLALWLSCSRDCHVVWAVMAIKLSW